MNARLRPLWRRCGGPSYARAAAGWHELRLQPVSREIVDDCLALTDALAPEIERIDAELRRHARTDPRVSVLTTPPGVGQFTALVLVAVIGDITRFPSARKLASWARLTPPSAARTARPQTVRNLSTHLVMGMTVSTTV